MSSWDRLVDRYLQLRDELSALLTGDIDKRLDAVRDTDKQVSAAKEALVSLELTEPADVAKRIQFSLDEIRRSAEHCALTDAWCQVIQQDVATLLEQQGAGSTERGTADPAGQTSPSVLKKSLSG